MKLFLQFGVAFIFAKALSSLVCDLTVGIRAHWVLGWALLPSQLLGGRKVVGDFWDIPEKGKSGTRGMWCGHHNVTSSNQPGAFKLSSWQVTSIWDYLSSANRGWQALLPQGPWPWTGEVTEHQQIGWMKRKISTDKCKGLSGSPQRCIVC